MAIKPITRLQHFLAAIIADPNAKTLKPKLRFEHFLGKAAKNPYAKDLTPINRTEYYLNGVAEAMASGGGSGDLSTATLTIINRSSTNGYNLALPVIPAFDSETSYGYCAIAEDSTEDFVVILYKGKTVFDDYGDFEVLNINGNIEKVGNRYVITGDCSMTIDFESY